MKLLVFTLLISISAFSVSKGQGKITVNQSPQISALLDKHVELNRKFRGSPGFRIQIYFGNGNKAKEEALRIRNSFSEEFPNTESYISFQTPFFKVRVGDYITRYDAYLAFQEISKKYPQAFLVEDLINPVK